MGRRRTLPEPTYTDYLELRKSIPPAPAPQEDNTRFYADDNGALRSLQSDGTDAPVAGAGVLPDPTDDGDVLTVVEGEWAGAPGGGSMPMQRFQTTLDAATVLGLATPVQLVACTPGEECIVPLMMSVSYLFGTTPYTDHGGNLHIGSGKVGSLMFNDWSTGGVGTAGFWDQTEDVSILGGNSFGLGIDAVSAWATNGGDLWIVADNNPTGGDGEIYIDITYVIARLVP